MTDLLDVAREELKKKLGSSEGWNALALVILDKPDLEKAKTDARHMFRGMFGADEELIEQLCKQLNMYIAINSPIPKPVKT